MSSKVERRVVLLDGVYMLRVLIMSSKVERRVVLLVEGVNCE